MEKKANEISYDDIHKIAEGIKEWYYREEERERARIRETIHDEKSKRKALDKNKEKYEEKRKKAPILNLEKKLKMMNKIADKSIN